MAKRRWIICISQVSLSLLHSLHAAVDGPHQRLLGQTLTITKSRVTLGPNQSKHLIGNLKRQVILEVNVFQDSSI